MTDRAERVHQLAREHGQEHLLADFPSLDARQRDGLLNEIEGLDFELVGRFRSALNAPEAHLPRGTIEPPEHFPLSRDTSQEKRAEEARGAGRELLSQGRVGYVLVAGGQASRLGYDGPKGAYRIAPVSDRTLFELHARRLLAARQRHGAPVPWYVMTSPANDAATRAFFAAQGWFGLEPGDVFFFSQAMVPAMDEAGRLVMSGPASLFLAPNGHGGLLLALQQSGALADMRRRGLEQLSYFQVDNPLVPPADPLFLGLHALARAGMSSKVVAKRDAQEKVGVIGRVAGRARCIEYSDLPEPLRVARDAEGRLAYRAGNIAVHVLDVAFVESLTQGGLKLPWHLARKKMNMWLEGRLEERSGVKFETFVFDALPLCQHSVVLEVDRAVEFSPVKNASGEDSPESCRADLQRLHAGFVRSAGLELPAANPNGLHAVEVDPLLAEDALELARRGPLRPATGPRGWLYA